MAAEIREITHSNRLTEDSGLAVEMLTEVLRLLYKHDELLERFRPLLEQYAAHGVIGMAVSARRARRAGGREQ